MLLMAKTTYLGIGISLLISFVVLTWVISCVYWFIEETLERPKILARITEAERQNDLNQKAALKMQLGTKVWHQAIFLATMLIIGVAIFVISVPYLLYLFVSNIVDQMKDSFSVATA